MKKGDLALFYHSSCPEPGIAGLARVASGEAALVVGTHAVIQDDVHFARLGLAIIDEQHRFGVHQRLQLRDKGRDGHRCPHQMVMTATPIPRTLAMSAYADLDTTVIDELPPGRTPVTTVAVSEARRAEVLERVRVACAGGRQAYWVCTLVEESETLAAQAATDTAAALAALLPELRVGLAHGRLKGSEKEAVMAAFKAGALDLLVATTVIEVGVDVPNASLMIIENAERLGLAQLHQLRGRVGRGAAASSCVLMYHPPLSEQGRARLGVLRETNDGFVIARRDLELRGPGEVLGLVGRNGVGKTTSLKAILGLVDVFGGTVSVRGHVAGPMSPVSACRLGIGYVSQQREVCPELTVEQNLMLPLVANRLSTAAVDGAYPPA